MQLRIKVPGKTFISGEYSVLTTGQAMVWTTEPCFEMRCRPCLIGEIGANPFHPESPAGKLWSSDSLFKSYMLDFFDPIRKGGFGGSTAEFLSLLKLQTYLRSQELLTGEALIGRYLQFAYNGKGNAPSGVDLWAQSHGGIGFYDKKSSQVLSLSWNFSQAEAYFIHTGHKLATHEHLKSELKIPVSEIEQALSKVKNGFIHSDLAQITEGINQNAQVLADASLTCENSIQLLKKIMSLEGVLAAKACGAMGADVILVIMQKSSAEANESALLAEVKCDKNLTLFASSENTSQGLVLEHLPGRF